MADVNGIAAVVPHGRYCPLNTRFESSLPQWTSLYHCECEDERKLTASAMIIAGLYDIVLADVGLGEVETQEPDNYVPAITASQDIITEV